MQTPMLSRDLKEAAGDRKSFLVVALRWSTLQVEPVCRKEVGSGGPRALQKVPKRALVRVDPLKKVLLRVSALLRVLKKVLLGVNH